MSGFDPFNPGAGTPAQAALNAAAESPSTARPRDELTIVTDGRSVSGWQSIRVTRGCESCPSDFDIGLTQYAPGSVLPVIVAAGTPCQVKIGGDLVLTGYIDRLMPALSARQHVLRIAGRSACEDLVDSSAFTVGNQISGGTFLSIARKIAEPFGIEVKSQTARADKTFPQFNFLLTETGYEIIERIARFLRVLVYDDTDGNLIIADVGTSAMSSGVVEGGNVQAASAVFSMDQRFRVYVPCLFATDSYHDLAETTGIDGNQPFSRVTDPGVPDKGIGGKPRLRQMVVVSSQAQADDNGTVRQLAEDQAQWEAARRRGRSQMLHVIVDSWRDSSGQLWRPNATIPVDLPTLYVQEGAGSESPWVIGQVSFLRDAESGTTAELILMPKEAFSVQPVPLVTFDWQTQQSINAASPEAKSLAEGTSPI